MNRTPDELTFPGKTLADLSKDQESIASLFREAGALYFPKLLCREEGFLRYVADLGRLTNTLGAEIGLSWSSDLRLEERLTILAEANRRSVGAIYDIGTRPAKLISAAGVKFHPHLLSLMAACFGGNPLLAFPTLSDTLHVFPPGEENYKYNLPIHQDFPYLLQSPEQITVWISLSAKAEGAGGITVWPTTQKLGIVRHRKNDLGHYESVLPEAELARYPSLCVEADFGDVLIANSLCLHRSEPNRTSDQTRITQLFRYSNLACAEAARHRWVSSEYTNLGELFPRLYPDCFAE